MKACQQLKPDFADYLTMLIRLFNSAISQPVAYKCYLSILKDNTGLLFFS